MYSLGVPLLTQGPAVGVEWNRFLPLCWGACRGDCPGSEAGSSRGGVAGV